MNHNWSIVIRTALLLAVFSTCGQAQGPNTCAGGGYTSCCTSSSGSPTSQCEGSSPGTCYCDPICFAFDDCCSDINTTCPLMSNPYFTNRNYTYVVYANTMAVISATFGDNPHPIISIPSGRAYALDVNIGAGKVYWSDNSNNQISQANLDGSNVQMLTVVYQDSVGDLAVDWISNKLYWTESRGRKISVMDLASMQITTLYQSSSSLDETYKAIAVDPTRRIMFWSTWSSVSTISSASMDFGSVRLLHNDLIQPNDIALDIQNQMLYWTDGVQGTIKYSGYTSNVIGTFYSDPSAYLFGISLDNYIIYFSDWTSNTVRYLHKFNPDGSFLTLKSNDSALASGLEVVEEGRQPTAQNPCESNSCSQICLLSSTNPNGYSCACTDGFTLDNFNNRGCNPSSLTDAPPTSNTCAGNLGFSTCCSGSVCGSGCYCDANCRNRGDCCSDIDSVCMQGRSSCAAAGHTTCCTTGDCQGRGIGDTLCFCDQICRDGGNCCDDINVTCPIPPAADQLMYIDLNVSDSSIPLEVLGHFDDGASDAVSILSVSGFPFGDTYHTYLFIGTNGIITFDEPLYSPVPALFPSSRLDVADKFVIAPFWDDVDIRLAGNIYYKVFTTSSGVLEALTTLDRIDSFIEARTGQVFDAQWMIVITWDQVHPWPHGGENVPDFYYFFYPDYVQNNTFQAILASNGSASYAIFTYRCGDINWSRRTGIGFNAAGRVFENHPLSRTQQAGNIDCSSGGLWTNVVYNLTGFTLDIATPSPIEPPQQSYVDIFDILNVNTTGMLDGCFNCTSAPIDLGSPGIPFGNYYHQTAYVGVQGIISFDRPFILTQQQAFPSQTGDIYFSYLVAPYWSNIDTRLAGSVQYEILRLGDSDDADLRFRFTNNVINTEINPNFTGNWILLANWQDVHPYPHGTSVELDRLNPYLEKTNSFQAIIISDGTKTYSVFTYRCADMMWSDEAVIGFNAAGDYFMNHRLTGEPHSNIIGCVHESEGVFFNNVIYDLTPGSSPSMGTPPPPPSSLGSCQARNFTECCSAGPTCLGFPADCSCDEFCHLANDCCHDILSTCTREPPPTNDSFLIFANRPYINRINYDGSYFHIIRENDGQIALGIDFDYRNGYIYWSDANTDQIYRSGFDGSGLTVVASASHEDIEDIAVDWVANNLYWTESITGNIEVLDLDTSGRTIVLNTGGSTIPRGIAVDPSRRIMFWTDWGSPAKIERASMDGSMRTTLHSLGLIWPNGITLDYEQGRIYWVDAALDRIEYSMYDGSQRTVLRSGLSHPFAITLFGDILYWTDWLHNSVFSTHKLISLGIQTTREHLRGRPYGIEALDIRRQSNVINRCDSSPCEQICLLSSNVSSGYKCACRKGFVLMSDGRSCMGSTGQTPPSVGSCVRAGFTDCCDPSILTLFCAGSEPYNCYCDQECESRGDCCSDIMTTCPRSGSCVNAGFQACCNLQFSSCVGDDGTCMCDGFCSLFGDCCADHSDICVGPPGSCVAAGFTSCCTSGDCLGANSPNCKCDAACRVRGDCCSDINLSCPTQTPAPSTSQALSSSSMSSTSLAAPTTAILPPPSSTVATTVTAVVTTTSTMLTSTPIASTTAVFTTSSIIGLTSSVSSVSPSSTSMQEKPTTTSVSIPSSSSMGKPMTTISSNPPTTTTTEIKATTAVVVPSSTTTEEKPTTTIMVVPSSTTTEEKPTSTMVAAPTSTTSTEEKPMSTTIVIPSSTPPVTSSKQEVLPSTTTKETMATTTSIVVSTSSMAFTTTMATTMSSSAATSSSMVVQPASSTVRMVPASSTVRIVPASSTVRMVPASSTMRMVPASSTVRMTRPSTSTPPEQPSTTPVNVLVTTDVPPATTLASATPTRSSVTQKPIATPATNPPGTSKPKTEAYTTVGVNVGSRVNTGAVAGGVIVAVVVLAVFGVSVVAALWFIRRCNKVKNTNYELFGNEEKQGDNEQDDKTPVTMTSFKSGEEKQAAFDNPMYATVKKPPRATVPPVEEDDDDDDDIRKEDLGSNNPGYKDSDDSFEL